MFDGRIVDADALIKILSDWATQAQSAPMFGIGTAASREATEKNAEKGHPPYRRECHKVRSRFIQNRSCV